MAPTNAVGWVPSPPNSQPPLSAPYRSRALTRLQLGLGLELTIPWNSLSWTELPSTHSVAFGQLMGAIGKRYRLGQIWY